MDVITYSRKAWEDVDEIEISNCIEGIYSALGWKVRNLHREDRVHEKGVDLLCNKNQENVAFACKKRPGTSDIDQLETFFNNTKGMQRIYVYINPPTRPFQERLDKLQNEVEIWDSDRLHEELVCHESVPYLCFYFSAHPIYQNLTGVINAIYQKRTTKYVPHKTTFEEVLAMWNVKDDIVKANTLLKFINKRWAEILMTMKERKIQDYPNLLNEVFKDLEIANSICGGKLSSSFSSLSKKYPDILSFYWGLVRQRSGWKTFAHYVESEGANFEKNIFNWIFSSISKITKDFCSSVTYILQSLSELAENMEYGIDQTFAKMVQE